MVFEIIDKSNPLITKKLFKKSNPYVGFQKHWSIYFSHAAVEKYELLKGKYIHFIKENNKLYFYVDNNKSGYAFNILKKDNSISIKIFSRPTYELLQHYFSIQEGDKFSLAPTNKKQNSNKLIEIILE